MNKYVERLYNGILKENPTFVLILGMCPTLAVTTSAVNGFGMGVSTLFVLVCSNVVISMLRKIIPDKVRVPAFIVVVASFVTILQFLLQAYLPFTFALTILGAFREIIGAGTIFGFNIPHWDGINIFVMAPGAFFVLAVIIAVQNYIRAKHGKKPRKLKCMQGCAGCSGCGNDYDNCEKEEKEEI